MIHSDGVMDGGSALRQGMARMRGGQWSSPSGVQKVEEMLSRAILHQEDLWGMLMIHEGGPALDANTGQMSSTETISPPVLRALKAKLENSMDWCHLALCRLKEIILHNPFPPQPSLGLSGGVPPNSYPKSEAKNEIPPSPKLNLPSPLSPLRVPLRKENISPHPLSGPPMPSANGGRSAFVWSPRSFFFNETPQPQLPAAPHTVDDDAAPLSILGPDVEHQQGQNFTRMSSLGMDSDWNLLAEAPVSNLPPPTLPTTTDPHQSSSSCQNQDADGNPTDSLKDTEDQSYVSKANGRGLRARSGHKRDREASADADNKVAVVFQQLKPGIDTKKGIPDDGHRGWKKYGNKSIQNSNFCRGYYKCSVKECKAKKMVQPTDKDPSIFEVTYVGKHTCSSTSQRRNRARTGAAQVQVEVMEAETAFGSGTAEEAASSDVPTTSTVTKEGEAVVRAKISQPWNIRGGGGGSEVEESSRATRSSEGSQEDGDERGRGEKNWTTSDTAAGIPSTSEKGRGVERGENKETNHSSYMNNTMPPALKPEDEDQDDGNTYLQQSSRHHQAVYTFPDPLLWPDLIDTNLSPAVHKSLA